jgi:predicted transcriptional regulator
MLLELLHAELVNQTVTREQLSVAAGLPLEVANRWVEALVQSGLCSSEADADARHVKLTPEGGAALRDYFVQLPQAIGHRS